MERKAKSKDTKGEHTNGKGIVRNSNVVGDPIFKRRKIVKAKRNKHQLQADGSNADLMVEEV
jgi:hypothetical protein